MDIQKLNKKFSGKVMLNESNSKHTIKYFKDGPHGLHIVCTWSAGWTFVPIRRLYQYTWADTGEMCKVSDFIEETKE